MSNQSNIEQLLLQSINSVSDVRRSSITPSMTFEELGLDSLAMNQMLLSLEELLGRELSPFVLERLADAKDIGDVLKTLEREYAKP